MSLDVHNGTISGSYGFQYRDGSVLTFDSVKDATGEPTFIIRLQDKTGKTIDNLMISATPDHRQISVKTKV